MAMEAERLVDLLRDLERRSREKAEGLPLQRDLTDYWEGVVFNVAGIRLIVALEEVSEILNQVPSMARVPGAKEWVKGVANIRGNLLPIIDLQGFLGGRSIVIGRRSRVLMIHKEGLSAGLLVSSVLGMRHFPVDSKGAEMKVNDAVKPYVDGGFVHDGEEWPVFSMLKLTADPAFQVASK